MRTAVICLAYLRNPAGVDLLAEYFSEANTDLFVHVDAKVDATPYTDTIERWGHVSMTPRLPIFWGGFNTVRAMIGAVETARLKAAYDRYIFLTEDTIPIVSRAEFIRCMASSTEWINTQRTTNPAFVARYDEFFFLDAYATTPRACRTVERAWTPEMQDAIARMGRLRTRGKRPIDALRLGSTWWALSAHAIDQILTSYHTDGHLRESFEFSALSEEHYPHTILGELPDARPMMFTDWSRHPTPYVFRTPEEIRGADTKGALFLRKVPLGSPEIVDFVRRL